MMYPTDLEMLWLPDIEISAECQHFVYEAGGDGCMCTLIPKAFLAAQPPQAPLAPIFASPGMAA